MTAFAAGGEETQPTTINEKSDPKSAQTDFGQLVLVSGRLEPGKVVMVNVESDYTLKNEADKEKTIPYDIILINEDGDTGELDESTIQESYFYAYVVGESGDLRIDIAQEDWDKAYAGSYSDTVTFNVSYGELTDDEEEQAEDQQPD